MFFPTTQERFAKHADNGWIPTRFVFSPDARACEYCPLCHAAVLEPGHSVWHAQGGVRFW